MLDGVYKIYDKTGKLEEERNYKKNTLKGIIKHKN